MCQQINSVLLPDQQKYVEDLWQKYFKKLSLIIYAKLGRKEENFETAMDITSETFFRALRAIHEGAGPPAGGEFQWLYRIAVNCLIDIIRKARRHPIESLMVQKEDGTWEERELEVEPSALSDLEREECIALLKQAISMLPEGQRKAIQMQLEDIKGEEIAIELGTSPGTVRVTLYRARQFLREYLEKGGCF